MLASTDSQGSWLGRNVPDIGCIELFSWQLTGLVQVDLAQVREQLLCNWVTQSAKADVLRVDTLVVGIPWCTGHRKRNNSCFQACQLSLSCALVHVLLWSNVTPRYTGNWSCFSRCLSMMSDSPCEAVKLLRWNTPERPFWRCSALDASDGSSQLGVVYCFEFSKGCGLQGTANIVLIDEHVAWCDRNITGVNIEQC